MLPLAVVEFAKLLFCTRSFLSICNHSKINVRKISDTTREFDSAADFEQALNV